MDQLEKLYSNFDNLNNKVDMLTNKISSLQD
jgi:hypothetical protein